MIRFDVLGTPVTQGSTKAFVVGKRAIVTHDKRKPLMDWRGDIAHAAGEAAGGQFAPAGVPVVVQAQFRLQKPQSTPKRITDQTKKPDLDKLTRSLLDALKGKVYADDSQVVRLDIGKRFARPDEAPGVFVEVWWE